jgi:hypothetical protein
LYLIVVVDDTDKNMMNLKYTLMEIERNITRNKNIYLQIENISFFIYKILEKFLQIFVNQVVNKLLVSMCPTEKLHQNDLVLNIQYTMDLEKNRFKSFIIQKYEKQ